MTKAPLHRRFAQICLVTFLSITSLVSGQIASAQDGGNAQDAVPNDIAVSVSPTGTQRFSRHGWTAVSVNGRNHGDTDHEEVISVYLGDESSVQFATRFWIPAGASRQSWLTIRVPDAPLTDSSINVSSLRLNETDGVEELQENYIGMAVSQRSVMLTDNEINTAVLVDNSAPNDVSGVIESSSKTLYDVLYAVRDRTVDSPLGVGMVTLNGNFLPPTPRALDELDQVIIASDRILEDTAGLAQIRAWIRDGGRLWIMIDRAGEEIAHAILGDQCQLARVDQIELNDFDLESKATILQPANSEAWSEEEPVPLVRVLTDADDVPTRIDGWPAAIWHQVGRGEVVLTTLGERGWMNKEEPSVAFRSLATRFFDVRNEPPSIAEPFVPILTDQIGYEIPSRAVAATVLGLNALIVLLAGCWWAKQRRLERLAFLIPVSAIGSAAVLLMVGKQHATAVPSSVASGQLVRVFDAVGEAKVSSISAVYSQDSGESGIVSPYRMLTIPLAAETGNAVTRIRWDDTGKSTWQGTPMTPGIRYAESNSTLRLEKPIRAHGTFDESGFVGTIDGLDPASTTDGLIIATPGPSTALSMTADGESIRAAGGIESLLSPGQYIPGALLSDVQRIRQDSLRLWFADPEQSPFGNTPSVLVWTNPFDLGLRFSDRYQVGAGAAVVALPVRLGRPADDSRYHIPATFISIQPYAGSRGLSSVFNARTGKWISMSKSNKTELSCLFPKSLMPMTVESLNVHLKISAPNRDVVIMGRVDGKPVELFRKSDPGGQLTFEIDQADALELDDDGGIWLSLDVTESASERQSQQAGEDRPQVDLADVDSWQIDRLHVSATAISR